MKLADIIENFISGDWGNETSSNEASNTVFCIRGADIIPISNQEFDKIPKRFVSDKTIDLKTLKEGDLIIEKSGGSPVQSTGRISYISKELIESKDKIVCSNFCTAIRLKSSWNPLYIYYYWTNIYNSGVFFNFEGKTSGIKNLQLENALSSIEIQEISLEKQNQIVNTLSAIDSKINNNRSINHNLEAMAKQLYDYWFVQFDFPDENGKPYKSSGGKMVWNEKLKIKIPQGWSTFSINEVSNSIRGVSYTKDDIVNNNQGILVLRGNNIQDNNLIFDNNVVFVPSSFVSIDQRISKYDVIMTMSSGSKEHIGKSTVFFKDSQYTYGAFLCKFTPKEGFSFLFWLTLNSEYFKIKIKSIASGTGINNLTNQTFDSIYIIIPTTDILNKFNKIVSPIFESLGNTQENSWFLTKQRDELLPLLMNGQVSVNSE